MAIRGLQSDVQDNWADGFVNAVTADRIPEHAAYVGKDVQFEDIGPGVTVLATRKGLNRINRVAADSPIVSQFQLTPDNATPLHILLLENGDICLNDHGTITPLMVGYVSNPTNFASWLYDTEHNFAYMVNGVTSLKTNGALFQKFGIDQPDIAHFALAEVGGGSDLPQDESYDVAVSYYNADTDHEGPLSDFQTIAITTADKQIQVTLPTAVQINDAQVTHVRVYLRQQSIQSELFLVVSGASPAIAGGLEGWAVGTTTITIDSSSVEISAFDVLAPDVNENFPPPSGAKAIALHKGYTFVATNDEILWSDIDDGESFNYFTNASFVGKGDGESIVTIASFKDGLIIFKGSKIYALLGDTPATWQVVKIEDNYGTLAPRSVATLDKKLYFLADSGPASLDSPEGPVTDITTQLLAPTFAHTNFLSSDHLTSIAVVVPDKFTIAFSLTRTIDEFDNQTVVPFNTKIERWEATEWRYCPLRSAAVVLGSNLNPIGVVSDDLGYLYQVNKGNLDGVPASENLVGVLTAAGTTDITDNTQNWTTDSLSGLFVNIWTTVDGVRNAVRARILSNTATTLTFTTPLDVAPSESANYAIGSIVFDMRTGFKNGGQGFFKKRVEFLFLQTIAGGTTIPYDVEVYVDLNATNPIMSRSVGSVSPAAGGDDLWDEGEWDDADWDGGGASSLGMGAKRIPVCRQAFNWQTRIVNLSMGSELKLLRTGMQWLTKSKKVGQGAI